METFLQRSYLREHDSLDSLVEVIVPVRNVTLARSEMRADEAHGRGVIAEPDRHCALVARGTAHAGLHTVYGNILDVRSKLRTNEHVETNAHQLLVSDQGELLVAVQDLG